MLDPDCLKALAALAEHRTFSAAGRALGLSQPAVFAQVRRLTEAVGTPLYARVGRGLALTPAGLDVAAHARSLAEMERDLVARLHGEEATSPLVLAAGAGAVLYVLGEGLRAFRRAHAGVRLDFLTADAQASVAAVERGAAHLGVAVLDAPPPRLSAARLTDVDQVFVAPQDDPLVGPSEPLSLRGLAGRPLVVPPEGRPHRAMLSAAFAARGLALVPAAEATGWELTLRLVSLGAGGAIVNASCHIPPDLKARRVRGLPSVRYYAFTRPNARTEAVALRTTLAAHGDAWRRGRG